MYNIRSKHNKSNKKTTKGVVSDKQPAKLLFPKNIISYILIHDRKKEILFFLAVVLVILLYLLITRSDITSVVYNDDNNVIELQYKNEDIQQINTNYQDSPYKVYTEEIYDDQGRIVEITIYTGVDKNTKIQTIKKTYLQDGSFTKEVFQF